MSTRDESKNLQECYDSLGLVRKEKEESKTWDVLLQEVTGVDPKKCPVCEQGEMLLVSSTRWIRGSPVLTPVAS